MDGEIPPVSPQWVATGSAGEGARPWRWRRALVERAFRRASLHCAANARHCAPLALRGRDAECATLSWPERADHSALAAQLRNEVEKGGYAGVVVITEPKNGNPDEESAVRGGDYIHHLVRIARELPDIQGQAPRLYAVTRNLARTAGRCERRRRRHEAVAAARRPGWFVRVEGGGVDGEKAAAALEGLPPDEREAVVARIWGGLNFEQIAGLLGTSAATAHRRFTAGLELLRERLSVPCPNSRSTPKSPR